MMDLFKGLGYKVTVVGRHRRETRAKVKLMTLLGPQVFSVKEGMFKKHYNIEDFAKYHPVKHLTTKDIMLESIPVSHPFMYFPQRVQKLLLWKADLVFTDAELYVKLPEKVNNIERKMIQYVHFPLETLKPVPGHPPKAVWCNSNFTKRHIKDFWGLHAEIVNPPTHCDFYRNSNGFDDREYDVVMFSRLHPDKIQTVIDSLKDYKVAIVGSSYGYEKEAPEWVSLFENATLKDVKNILSDSKIYIHGKGFGVYAGGKESLPEHFGQTVCEAQASGCAAIVPRTGGIWTDIANYGKYALGFSSLKELKTHIQKLLENKNYWEKWHQKSLAGVKRFDTPTIAKKVQKLLENFTV